MALMVGWEGLAQPTTTVAMGVMVEKILLTPGAAILLQTPTVVVVATVQHLVQITIMRTGMEKVVVTAVMERMVHLPIPLVIHREVVLQAIIMVVQRRTGAGVEGGNAYMLDLY